MDRSELIAIRYDLLKRSFHPDHTPTLVAVTKKMPFSDIRAAYEAGMRDFGENRVDELEEKAQMAHEANLKDIRWHFIGNLQSNKVGKLLQVPGLHAIHSVSSFKLVQKIADQEENFKGKELLLFLQINTSNEKEKGGFIEWDDMAGAVNLLLKRENSPLKLHGFMTMSKLRTNKFQDDALKCFEQLKKVRSTVEKDFDLEDLKLSMGMSSDYQVALQVGTDYIRIGSALFAPYNKS